MKNEKFHNETAESEASNSAIEETPVREDVMPVKVRAGRGKRAVRIAFTCLGYAVLLFLAVTLVWLLIDKFVKKSPAPGAFGYSPLVVATGSMSETINAGDMVIIHKQQEYAVQDIISFMPEGATIPTTHRIVKINEDGTFTTRGDANNVDDPPVKEEMILGKVVAVIPKVGLFVKWLKEAYGWIYLLAAVLLSGVAIYVLRKHFD